MDPNNNNPQSGNQNLDKLEQDLEKLTKEAGATTQPAPEVPTQPVQPLTPQPTEVPQAPVVEPTVPSQPIETPPAPPNVSVEGGKKGSSLMAVAMTLLIIAVVVAVGYVAYTKFIVTTPTPTTVPVETALPTETPIPEVTPQASTSATPDLTANWKTYNSVLYQYSVKYPTDWQTTETKHNAASIIDPSKNKLMTDLSNGKSSIQIFYEGDFDHGSTSMVFKSSEKVSIGGKEATKNIYTLEGNSNEWINYTIEGFHDFRIEANVTPSDKSVVNQILSTFQFTSSTPSATP